MVTTHSYTMAGGQPSPASCVGALQIQPDHRLQPRGGKENGCDHVRSPLLTKKLLYIERIKTERGTLTSCLKHEGITLIK